MVTMPQRCRKITEVLNKIFLRSYSSFFNSGRFSVYISVFLSLVEGDNPSEPVQETNPGNCFELSCIKSFLSRRSLVG